MAYSKVKKRALVATLILSFCAAYSLEIPLEFSGRAYVGKYLNSTTTRFNLDVSLDVYCTLLRARATSLFVRYRDDLDMAEQEGGIRLDPRYAHYYISSGIDYLTQTIFISAYYMHDCVHDIDYAVEGTPIFNRLRLQIGDIDFYRSRSITATKRFLWSIEFGYYPHWQYSGWDINAGADYNFDLGLRLDVNIMNEKRFGILATPTLLIAASDSSIFHQHAISLSFFFRNNTRRMGVGLLYNLKNNDPIKNPNKLWQFLLFFEF